MPDLKKLITEFANVADLAATVLPAAGIAGGVARIGQQIIGIIDDLKPHAPDAESKAQLEAAHDKLMAAVTKKAEDTSAKLRGEE